MFRGKAVHRRLYNASVDVTASDFDIRRCECGRRLFKKTKKRCDDCQLKRGKTARNREMEQLYQQGLTIQAVADRFGIKRSTAYAAIMSVRFRQVREFKKQ